LSIQYIDRALLGRMQLIREEFSMKKIALVLIIAAAGGLAAFAQPAPGQFGPRGWAQANQATVKVDGQLSLVNGFIAVVSGGKTYYVHRLNRLVGFIDGLKEGAYVKLEGYENTIAGAPTFAHLLVVKLTYAGKDYDLSQSFGRGPGMAGGRHPMMGGPNGGPGQGGFQGRGGKMGGRW
jgi:hypothetical protein